MEKIEVRDQDTASFEKGYNLLMAENANMKLIGDEPNQKSWKFIDESTGLLVLKSVYQVEMPLSHAYKMSDDNKLREQWDKEFFGFEDLGLNSSGEEVLYWKIKMPTFVTNRDFVVKRLKTKNFKEFDICILVESTEHPSKPGTSSLVRAVLKSYIFLKKIDEQTTEIQIVMSLDPKGLIPKFAFNTMANQVPKRVHKDMVAGYLKVK